MTDDFLKSCKKCFIKTIISPGMFWMSDYNKDNQCFKNQMLHLESLLAKDCRKSLEPGQISTGQIVAVENNLRLCRGIILDIYNKNSKCVYEILLIDYGNIIKWCGSKIFKITNTQLRSKKSSAFKFVLHDVQPLALDINDNSNIASGVFQKRISSTWSVAALKFVKSQLNVDLPVYVKFINVNDDVTSGEIYIIKEPAGEAKSLSVMLCENDFAIFCKDTPNSSLKSIPEGVFSFNNIVDKIPTTAMSRRMKNFNIYKNHLSRDENLCSNSLNSEKFREQSLVKPILDLSIQNNEVSQNSQKKILGKANSVDSGSISSNETMKVNSLVSRKTKQHHLSFSSLNSATIDQQELNKNNSCSSLQNPHYSIFALVKRHEKLLKHENS